MSSKKEFVDLCEFIKMCKKPNVSLVDLNKAFVKMKNKQYTLRLKRTDFLSDRILGVLSFKDTDDDSLAFDTLEPIVKPKYGCVPKGIYRLTKRYSPKFKKQMYYLAYVPGRSAIMIHSGNTPKDTKGCILVGFTHGDIKLSYSRKALEYLTRVLNYYYDEGYNINLIIE